MKYDISKNTDFEIIATPLANVNISKKSNITIGQRDSKLRERGSSASEIVHHLLETNESKKPATPTKPAKLAIVLKKIALSLQDKVDIP